MGEMLPERRLCQNARPATVNTETMSISEVKGAEDGKIGKGSRLDATSALILGLGLRKLIFNGNAEEAKHAGKCPKYIKIS